MTLPRSPSSQRHMDRPGLLFVHQNSSLGSLSCSSKQEKQEINRHVQLGRKHERYKKLVWDRWHLPFVFRRNTSPPRSQPIAAHSVPRTVSANDGSGSGRTTTQTTHEQPWRSLQSGHASERRRNVSQTNMESAPVPPDNPFQLIQYDPAKTAPESIHAIRSNAVRYQWKRSKEVRPKGRKSRMPQPPMSSSQPTSGTRGKRYVGGNAQSAQTETDPRTIPREETQMIKVTPPNGDASLQPGGYPTELPSKAVAPLLHLGRCFPSILWAECVNGCGGLTMCSLRNYQQDVRR
jgi:hypothetical protein